LGKRVGVGEDDTLAPPQYAKELAEGMPGSRLRLYPGDGHISILDRPINEIVETLLAPNRDAFVYEGGILQHAIHPSAWKGNSANFAFHDFCEVRCQK
jgi:hypothetical protein